MSFRIEIGIHYTDADAIKVQYPSGGAFHTENLNETIGATEYVEDETAEGLRDTLEDHLKEIHSGFSVANGTAKTFTIAHSSNTFQLFTDTHQSLSDFLGLPTTNPSGATVTGGDAPCIFESERAAVVSLGWRWYNRKTAIRGGECSTVNLLRVEVYRVRLQITRDELKAFRRTARYMLQGMPFTLYQTKDAAATNGFKSTAFSGTNVDGKIYMQLDPSSPDLVETQLTEPFQSDVQVEFTAVEVDGTGYRSTS